MSHTLMLDREDGRIAYDVQGDGPLVICAPGMGDIRQTFRYLVPALLDAGYRVATFDIRGHGESDTTFHSYDDEAEASDIIALAEHLGSRASVVGNSMGAAAGVIAAAARPELIGSLVLVGPYARNPKVNPLMMAVMRVAMAAPWAAAVWKAYLPSLYAGRKPADQAEFAAAANAAMRRKGYATTFSKTTHLSHAPAEAVLPQVHAPALVVMGELDPDFPNPVEEAAWIKDQLNAEVLMVPEAGHYPQSQQPELVNPAVVAFLKANVA
ncbi:MAG TPA: alpha/beta hydrolase [Galbitalea sp.]|nr:alpha/beta hydrolase [Galbitalea sp.]